MFKSFIPILFLLLLSLSTWAQVSIDSVHVKLNAAGYDTAHIFYTTTLGKLNQIGITVYNNNGCYSNYGGMIFDEDSIGNSLTFDTVLQIGYFGLTSGYFRLDALWDTSDNTIPPPPFITMDTYIYDSCSSVSLHENSQTKRINLFPNPSRDYIRMQLPADEELQSLKIFDLKGQSLLVFQKQRESYAVGSLPAGVYVVVVELKSSISTSKKILIYK